MTDHKNYISQAQKLLGEGKAEEARKVLSAISHKNDNTVEHLRRRARDLIARKYLRQKRESDFAKEAAVDAALGLALARMQGPTALAAFAQKHAETFDGTLAKASLAEDPRQGLAILRRLPGLAPIAEGWMALLRSDTSRAETIFSGIVADLAIPTAIRQRARCGLALVLAQQGEHEQAKVHWDTLAPLPQTVYPQTSAFGRSMVGSTSSLSGEGLRRLLVKGDISELETASRASLSDANRGRILLRLGDLRWMQQDERNQFCPKEWKQAQKLDPTLQLDVLKRHFWIEIRQGAAEGRAALLALHAAVLAKNGAQAARQVFDTLTAEIPVQVLSSLELPTKDLRYPEFQRAWLKILLAPEPEMGFDDWLRSRFSGRRKTPWRDIELALKVLESTYQDDPGFRADRRALMVRYKKWTPLRKVLFSDLQSDPSLISEILPLYMKAGLQAKAKIPASEIEILEAILGRPDYDLLLLKVQRGKLKTEEIESIAHRLPNPFPALFLCEAGIASLPPSTLAGHDEAFDLRLIRTLTTTKEKTGVISCVQALIRDPIRLHSILKLHRNQLGWQVLDRFCDLWKKVTPKDWWPLYHLAMNPAREGYGRTFDNARDARKMMRGDEPEIQDINKILEQERRHNAAIFGSKNEEDFDNEEEGDNFDDVDPNDPLFAESTAFAEEIADLVPEKFWDHIPVLMGMLLQPDLESSHRILWGQNNALRRVSHSVFVRLAKLMQKLNPEAAKRAQSLADWLGKII